MVRKVSNRLRSRFQRLWLEIKEMPAVVGTGGARRDMAGQMSCHVPPPPNLDLGFRVPPPNLDLGFRNYYGDPVWPKWAWHSRGVHILKTLFFT